MCRVGRASSPPVLRIPCRFRPVTEYPFEGRETTESVGGSYRAAFPPTPDGFPAMQDSRVRGLSVFLRIYGWASLLLFSGLMVGFVTKAQALDEGSAWHWLIWDRVGDHVAPMLLAVYVVWSIFIIRAARDPIANKTFL